MRGKWALLFAAGVLSVAIVTGWIEVRHGFSAHDNATALEAFVARNVRIMAIPGKAKSQRNPYTVSPEILTDARRHFADHCAICHANNGSGDSTIGRNLYPKVPDMRQTATQSLTDGELYYIIQNGIRLTGMPAWGQAHEGADDADSWKLVFFIRHLPKVTPEEEKDMERYNPRSAAEQTEEEEEEEFLKGGNPPQHAGEHHH